MTECIQRGKKPQYLSSVSSAVGGTSSALTGGSFANGAVTGAFTTIFNHTMHDGDDIPEQDDYSRYKKKVANL